MTGDFIENQNAQQTEKQPPVGSGQPREAKYGADLRVDKPVCSEKQDEEEKRKAFASHEVSKVRGMVQDSASLCLSLSIAKNWRFAVLDGLIPHSDIVKVGYLW